jgi:L-amino acid N-acyltransferase YncA
MEDIIRKMRLDEVPDILILIPAWIGDEHIGDVDFSLSQNSHKELSKREISKSTLCLVAETGNRIVGVLTCQRGRQNSVNRTATLHLYIDPKSRDRAINKNLVKESIEWARHTGIFNRIQTQIRNGDDLQIEIFRQLGFEVEATLRNTGTFRDTHFDSVVMALIW